MAVSTKSSGNNSAILSLAKANRIKFVKTLTITIIYIAQTQGPIPLVFILSGF